MCVVNKCYNIVNYRPDLYAIKTSQMCTENTNYMHSKIIHLYKTIISKETTNIDKH